MLGNWNRLGRNAHHRERLAVELDRPPQNCRLGVEPPTPQAVAQDGHALLAFPVLTGKEPPAELGANAQHVEQARRDTHRIELLRFAGAGQRHRDRLNRRQPLEGLRPLLPLGEMPRADRQRRIRLGEGRQHFAQGYQALRITIA